MKKMKKMLAVMLAFVMAFGMAVTTFAAPTNTTITVPENGHTYEVYQIMTGELLDGKLAKASWGADANKEGAVSEADMDAIVALAGSSDAKVAAAVAEYVNIDGTSYKTVKDGSVTVPTGYYLIKDNGPAGENETLSLYLVKVVGPTEITPKTGTTEVEKKIVEGDNRVETNEASIGDKVNYEITAKMPENIADFNEYYLRFNDTLSKGLTFNNDVKVMANGKDITNFFYVGTKPAADNATAIEISIEDLKWTRGVAGEITKDTVVTVTYSATLNENAVIAGNGNPNDVTLDYSNDPNNSGDGYPGTTPPGDNPPTPPNTPPEVPPTTPPTPHYPTGETPEQEVVTYTTEITITKTDDAGNILTGAEFTLTGNGVNVVLVTEEKFVVAPEGTEGAYWKLKDGTYTTEAPVVAEDETDNTDAYDSITVKYNKTTELVAKGNVGETATAVKGMVATDGTVTFTGLGAGNYTIEETVVPDGYNKAANIDFEVTFDVATKKFVSNKPNVVKVGTDNKLSTTVENKKGAVLPETGGIGTTLFYILGTVMVLGAGVLLITRRRMAAK